MGPLVEKNQGYKWIVRAAAFGEGDALTTCRQSIKVTFDCFVVRIAQGRRFDGS
jgi:hypothetical protein